MQNFGWLVYDYTEGKAETLLRGLSVERLSRYSELAPHDKTKQLQLYAWNTALSESLYTPIQGLEIVTRNYFHTELTKCYGEQWCYNPKIKFSHSQAQSISQAKEALLRENKPLTSSNIIATLSFGFWTGLLSSKYETSLWRTCLYKTFVNKSSPFLRKNTHQEFDLIRILRNRIAHHEPILRADLPNHHLRIFKMVKWLCEETACWINAQSRFPIIWDVDINPFI